MHTNVLSQLLVSEYRVNVILVKHALSMDAARGSVWDPQRRRGQEELVAGLHQHDANVGSSLQFYRPRCGAL